MEAYREYEIAAMLDLNDPNRFVNLAIEILNNHYIRTSETSIVKLPQTENVFFYIMPMFIYALEISNTNAIRTRIAELLLRRNQNSYANAIIRGNDIDQSQFHRFSLDYILNTDVESIKTTI